MKRSDVIRSVGPSVVAFGSRLASTNILGPPPPFPPIVGTGFIVDSRGLVITNRHVIEEMDKIPPEARFVMLFPKPQMEGEKIYGGILTRRISRVFVFDAVVSPQPLFGEDNPDFAFAEIDIQGLPSLNLSNEPSVIEVGSEIATMGFPMGEEYLSPYSDQQVSQISPFARHGIISSVLPCECPHPHGFSIDVLSESGASGSPIFLAEDGRVIGILHAGVDSAPVTYGVPAWILKQGLEALDWSPQETKMTLTEVIEAERPLAPKASKPLQWTTTITLNPRSKDLR
jgi:S1-C subfamily serine protease